MTTKGFQFTSAHVLTHSKAEVAALIKAGVIRVDYRNNRVTWLLPKNAKVPEIADIRKYARKGQVSLIKGYLVNIEPNRAGK